MGRGLWFVAGAGTGVYAMVRARRIAEAFTPEGLADRVGALALGARLLAEDVRTATAARESEIRAELGLSLDGGPTRALGTADREATSQATAPATADATAHATPDATPDATGTTDEASRVAARALVASGRAAHPAAAARAC